MSNYPIVHVVWTDSETRMDGWEDADTFIKWSETPPAAIDSAGYLTYQCEDYIVLSMCVHEDTLSDHIKIPTFAITQMDYLTGEKATHATNHG